MPRSSATIRRTRHAAHAGAGPRRARAGSLHARAGARRRADRLACQRLEPFRPGAVPGVRARRRVGCGGLRPSLGHDGPGAHAEILAALAGGHAGRGVARHLFADLRRRAGAAAALAHRIRPRRRRVSGHAGAHPARLRGAARSLRGRQSISPDEVLEADLRRLVGSRRARASPRARYFRRRAGRAGERLSICAGRIAARGAHRVDGSNRGRVAAASLGNGPRVAGARAGSPMNDSAAWARAQDAADALSPLRSEFLFPEAGPLYFAGHSLGLQPRRAREYVIQELEDWARYGVEGHFAARNPWVNYHELLTASTARLVGALPGEVVVMNTLTVNLHLLMVSFYRPRTGKFRILIESGAFPSDRYAVASQARFHGFPPDAVVESDDPLRTLEERGDEIALALIGQPNYLTGRAFDVPALVRAARTHDCNIGLDLAHGAGNLELRLHEWGPDFAAWCNYKYLNAGPGGLGGVFVHERHEGTALPRLEGWWGHDKEKRFEMGPRFSPIPGAEAWQLSNPPIFQMAALRASMELFDRATMPALRRKGDALTSYLEGILKDAGVELLTPPER